jgi:O-antigen ligase
LLLAHFRRSDHGRHVLHGFLVSAICLLIASFVHALTPALQDPIKPFGVPVKDYILQSGIFLICAFALAGAAIDFWRAHNRRVAIALIVLAALFVADIGFVITSRTVVVVAPFLIAMLGWRHYGWKGVVAAVMAGAVIAGALWVTSPRLRDRAAESEREMHDYVGEGGNTSAGQHLNFLKMSLRIVETAPLFGHGTGSIPDQFRRIAADHTGLDSIATVNPHNQVFGVAIQLGLLGTAVLLAMWTAHLLLFRGVGLTAWIGTVMVVQNVISGLFNSHLFDFSQGWLYVFGVGVAGGMMLRERDKAPASRAAQP